MPIIDPHNMKKEKCKEKVYPNERWGSFHPHRCKNNAWKDGYCKQHHPDTAKEREQKSEARWEAKRKRSPEYKLKQAGKEIERLKKALGAIANSEEVLSSDKASWYRQIATSALKEAETK